MGKKSFQNAPPVDMWRREQGKKEGYQHKKLRWENKVKEKQVDRETTEKSKKSGVLVILLIFSLLLGLGALTWVFLHPAFSPDPSAPEQPTLRRQPDLLKAPTPEKN